MDLEEFYQDFFQDVLASADADGRFAEDAFFELVTRELIEAGELDTADRARYVAPRGLRIDGYGGDPLDADGRLTLIVLEFVQSGTIETLTGTQMDAAFKRLESFLSKARDSEFRSRLEVTNPGFGAADLISRRLPHTTSIRLLLVTNRLLSARVDGREAGDFESIPVTYSVWDIGRLHKYVSSGQAREELEIDLESEFGGPLVLLPAHLEHADYQAYLAAFPGRQLAAIYDRWGARLLEQNVRCFLQARSSVNKGIKATIENSPEMFFAFNNGITATAQSITTRSGPSGLLLTGMKNFQIVNGGQTTASLHAALKNSSENLDRVFVQMKLSIVEPARAPELVPKISEFANSQNRVNAADFFANHPFHVRVEEFSRRILAPSPDGSFVQSKWFYERARGQYHDARAYLTPSQLKKFDVEFPKRQMFSKTDLAKFLNVWMGHPNVVSAGAQKNFAHFARAIGKAFDENPNAFNELFYRESIAKAIVFRHVEDLVPKQSWYGGGYRANIVAYTIAKLAHVLQSAGKALDFERIWSRQSVSPALSQVLELVAEAVHQVIISPPPGISNVTEWAKKDGCWQRVQDLPLSLPSMLDSDLVSGEEVMIRKKAAAKDQKVLNEAQAMVLVLEAGSQMWRGLKEWGQRRKLLSAKEAGILDSALSMPGRLPTDRQCMALIEILRRMRSEGCDLGQDVVGRISA
ncbi:MAG: AIPR family protein [Gemmatimonadales bacterium]